MGSATRSTPQAMMALTAIYYDVIPGNAVRLGKWDREGKEMKLGHSIQSHSMLGHCGWILQRALEAM